MIYYFMAMEKEFNKVKADNKYLIGMNAINMPQTTSDDIIINVGYCGSSHLKIGTVVEPLEAINIDTGVKYSIDPIFNKPHYTCYTSSVFVEETDITEQCIFDMELAKIAALPHKKLYSLKIVSDNLDEDAFDAYDPDEVWVEINELISTVVKLHQ